MSDQAMTLQQQQDQLLTIQAQLEDPTQSPEQQADLYFEQGFLYAEISEFSQAIASYDKAIALKPDYHEVWYWRGAALAKLHRYKAAFASFDQAYILNPANNDQHNNASFGSLLKQVWQWCCQRFQPASH